MYGSIHLSITVQVILKDTQKIIVCRNFRLIHASLNSLLHYLYLAASYIAQKQDTIVTAWVLPQSSCRIQLRLI